MTYKQKYLHFFCYGQDEFIPSELSGKPAIDIHHISFKSKTHKNQDTIKNLCAVTREEHDKLHARQISEAEAQEKHDSFVISFLVNNKDRIADLDESSLDYYNAKLSEIIDPYKPKIIS